MTTDLSALARVLAGIDTTAGDAATAAWAELLQRVQKASPALYRALVGQYDALNELGPDITGGQARRIEGLLAMLSTGAVSAVDDWLDDDGDGQSDDDVDQLDDDFSADDFDDRGDWTIDEHPDFSGDDSMQFASLWDEDEHPRNDDGEFTRKSGGGATAASDFALSNSRKGKQRFENVKTKQKKLLDGMDALPGQQDLFDGGDSHAPAKLPIEKETYTTFKHPEEGYIDLRRLALHGPPRQSNYELIETYKAEHHRTPVIDEAHGRKLLAHRISELKAAGWRHNEQSTQFATSGDQAPKVNRTSSKVTGAGEHWVTIGAHTDGAGKKHGGVPVLIRGGKIVGGPARLKGKALSSFSRDKQPDSKLDHAVRSAAKEHRLPRGDLRDAVHFVHSEKLRTHQEREAAKGMARKATGLTAGDISRLANAGHDYASAHKAGGATGGKFRHFDEVAQEVAREHPELGLGDADAKENFAENLWNVLAEGKREPLAKHHPEVIDEAVKLLKSSRPTTKADKQRYEEMSAIPFSTAAGPAPDLAGVGQLDATYRRMPRLLEH